jgi:hypothetical protein
MYAYLKAPNTFSVRLCETGRLNDSVSLLQRACLYFTLRVYTFHEVFLKHGKWQSAVRL